MRKYLRRRTPPTSKSVSASFRARVVRARAKLCGHVIEVLLNGGGSDGTKCFGLGWAGCAFAAIRIFSFVLADRCYMIVFWCIFGAVCMFFIVLADRPLVARSMLVVLFVFVWCAFDAMFMVFDSFYQTGHHSLRSVCFLLCF